MDVRIKVQLGPVKIDSLAGKGAHSEYTLWDGVIGEEDFPAITGTAFYNLILRKNVGSHAEVDQTEITLRGALQSLRNVWPFAGGGKMVSELPRSPNMPEFSSNAKQVKQQLLLEEGLVPVSSRNTLHYENGASYQHMPLKKAIELCLKSKRYPELDKMFDYYFDAYTDEKYWYVPLYKVLDVLKKKYGNEENVKKNLKGGEDDWKDVKKMVNHETRDLRHAPKDLEKVQEVESKDKNETMSSAYRLINLYIAQLEKM